MTWLSACSLTFCLFAVALRAADDGPVYVDPAQADEDFAFQGEYRGFQRAVASARSSEPIGLQVIARGNGQFEAVKFYGGLPGEFRFRSDRFPLHGRRIDDLVLLDGDQFDIVLEAGQRALITARDGREAGELRKVQRVSPTMGAPAPPGAILLFDGTDTGRLVRPKITEQALLLAGTETAEAFQNFRLHIEFRLPYQPLATGQARGNSGVYLQSRYEVQILDSFGLEGLFNECGSLYRQRPPDINACLPPLEWQTYDIEHRSPRFDASGRKTENARITVWLNGILVHNDVEILSKTGAGREEGPAPFPTKLQDHGNPVVFRNFWILTLNGDAG